MSLTREQIANILAQGEATVKFTKVDGSERLMRCTKAPHLIPEDKQPKGDLLTEVQPNLSVLRVFDLDMNEWRSFKVSNVKEVTVGYQDRNSTELLQG
jgi:hypothetical protein